MKNCKQIPLNEMVLNLRKIDSGGQADIYLGEMVSDNREKVTLGELGDICIRFLKWRRKDGTKAKPLLP